MVKALNILGLQLVIILIIEWSDSNFLELEIKVLVDEMWEYKHYFNHHKTKIESTILNWKIFYALLCTKKFGIIAWNIYCHIW